MFAAINDFLGQVLVYTLIPLGLWFTVSSRFVQLRYFKRMFRVLGGAFHHKDNHLTSFQALALSVGGRVGAGNIAGVAVAITLGGPGAVFWMWIVGLMGMATSFFECTLAQTYKIAEDDGTYRGGPAYYIERGLGQKWLAMVFSVLLLITFGFAFNAVQSFAMASSLNDAFGVPVWVTCIGLVLVVGSIIIGGIRRIADVAETIVPFMALGYLLMALVVIALNIGEVPAAFMLIIKSAFGLEQAVGGGIGAAILMGVKRGLFSNEAGLGSAPNVAAVAYVPHPANQGMVQSLSVFIDTLLMCTCTAMIILLSDVYQNGADVGGVVLTQNALAAHVGEWGRGFVSLALALFTFTSMIYCYYLGENSINYFSDNNQTAFAVYRVLVLTLLVWAALQDLSSIFAFSDITMALLAIVNLAALVMLFKTGRRILADYDEQVASGVETPVFDPAKFPDLKLDPKAWDVAEAVGHDDRG